MKIISSVSVGPDQSVEPAGSGYVDRRYVRAALWMGALCLLVVGSLLWGCAAPAHQLENATILPEIDVVAVKENSDEALRIAQEAKLEVEMVNTKMTAMDNKLVLLSEEVASVSVAKIEELETRMTLIIEALKDVQAQLDALEVSPRTAKQASPGKNPAAPRAAGARSSTFSVSSPEYAVYQTALQTFNARNFDKAAELFKNVMTQYPSGAYVDNCQYWIAECEYAKGDYVRAIAAFQKVLAYQNSSKADDAIFKIGKSYLAVGQTGKAKEMWSKLVFQFPSSEYVPRAQQYMTEVK